jgi:hypothetical protein
VVAFSLRLRGEGVSELGKSVRAFGSPCKKQLEEYTLQEKITYIERGKLYNILVCLAPVRAPLMEEEPTTKCLPIIVRKIYRLRKIV